MNHFQDSGIILSVRLHGETGGIVSVLTQNHGRCVGYIYGASSSSQRPVLMAGNQVSVEWQAKSSEQLGSFKLELEKSCAAEVLSDPMKLTAVQSACALADKTLPEREKHSSIYEGLKAFLSTFDSDIWQVAYIYWEIGLLRELGFGLDLSRCVVSGAVENLDYVSPKSGCAVSRASAGEYKTRLLVLPAFLRGEAKYDPEDIYAGLKLTGHFLFQRVFAPTNQNLPEPRLRLEEKSYIVIPEKLG